MLQAGLKPVENHTGIIRGEIMAEAINLTGVLDILDKKADDDRITIGSMVEAIGNRGYGPLILAAALIELLPTGGIPGIPTMVALLVILFAGQMVAGRQTPWIPEKLRTKGVAREKFEKAREKIKPVTTRIDRVLKPRISSLTTPAAARLVGITCILLAMTMPPMEVVPFLSYIPAAAIALFAVGLCAKDGLVILFGFIVAVAGGFFAINWLFL